MSNLGTPSVWHPPKETTSQDYHGQLFREPSSLGAAQEDTSSTPAPQPSINPFRLT